MKLSPRDIKGSAGFATIGLDVVLSIMIGFFGGRKLDEWLGTAPYLAIVGFCLGLATAGKFIYEAWRSMEAETRREERAQGNPEPLFEKFEKERSKEVPNDSGEGSGQTSVRTAGEESKPQAVLPNEKANGGSESS